MNFHSTSLRVTGVSLSRCASLTLLSILGSECFALTHPPRVGYQRPSPDNFSLSCAAPSSAPYLTVILVPALTFQAAPPPVDPSLKLAAGAPPRPGGAIEEIAAANQDAALVPQAKGPEVVVPAEAEPPTESPATIAKSKPPALLPPVAILRDDTLPTVRPEDVLPYFQYPGSVPSAPLPAAVPPSSATYRQR